MKLGLLGFTGNTITDRTANLGIYRPESNEHIQSFNGGPECYVLVGQSPALTGVDPNIDIPGLFIGGDQGQYAFVYNRNTRQVYRYTLLTPWDISTLDTASITGSRNLNSYLIERTTGATKTNINPNWVDTSPTQNPGSPKSYYDLLDGQGIRFSPDGTKMHILDGNAGYCKIVQFTLNTPWDLSDGSLSFPDCRQNFPPFTPAPIFWTISGTDASNQAYLSYKLQDRDFCFSDDGLNLYVLGTRRQPTTGTEQVHRFILKSGRTPFDIGSYAYSGAAIENSSVISGGNNANYTIQGGSRLITGTSYEGSYGNIRGMCVNNNSNKMYLIGITRAVLYGLNYDNSFVGVINAPTLNISTTGDPSNNMSYVGALNSGEREPQGVFMNTQNNNMDFYIVGNGSKTIFQYKLVLK